MTYEDDAKPKSVKILQITSASNDAGYVRVHGLGSDGKVYEWDQDDTLWLICNSHQS